MKAFPTHKEEGMELRDYFAAKAMQGAISFAGIVWGDGANSNDALGAERAYKIADAMMKAREPEDDSHEVIAAALARLNKAAENNGETL
jgi:hypothetical protein